MWEGLKAPGKEWRRLYKVLHLTEHLLRFGSTGCVQDIKDGAYKLRELLDFSYNEDGTERGSGSKSHTVRDKAKAVMTLIQDHRLLEEEREAGRKQMSRYVGISSDDYHGRSAGGYGGNSGGYGGSDRYGGNSGGFGGSDKYGGSSGGYGGSSGGYGGNTGGGSSGGYGGSSGGYGGSSGGFGGSTSGGFGPSSMQGFGNASFGNRPPPDSRPRGYDEDPRYQRSSLSASREPQGSLFQSAATTTPQPPSSIHSIFDPPKTQPGLFNPTANAPATDIFEPPKSRPEPAKIDIFAAPTQAKPDIFAAPAPAKPDLFAAPAPAKPDLFSAPVPAKADIFAAPVKQDAFAAQVKASSQLPDLFSAPTPQTTFATPQATFQPPAVSFQPLPNFDSPSKATFQPASQPTSTQQPLIPVSFPSPTAQAAVPRSVASGAVYPPQPQARIHHNMEGVSGPSLSQLKSTPSARTEFSEFQSALPESQKKPTDIESLLTNLDNLQVEPKKKDESRDRIGF